MASVAMRSALLRPALLRPALTRLSSSSGAAPLTVSIDQATRSAKIVMHGPQSNAVTVELLKSLHGALDTIEADRGLRGLVLTSSVEKYFSVGISLDVFTSSNEVQWRQFWSDVRNFFIRIHNSRLVSVAAINGHAPGINEHGGRARSSVRADELTGVECRTWGAHADQGPGPSLRSRATTA